MNAELPADALRLLDQLVKADEFKGVISARSAAELAQIAGISLPELALALVPTASDYAYPPISHFYVGAVVVGKSDSLYFGANIEFPGQTLNATIHAEQAAVLNAWLHGEAALSMLAVNGSPCGHCRQFLFEINDPDLSIVTPEIEQQSIRSLLPYAFSPAALGNEHGLFETTEHHLVTQHTTGNETAETARAMASRSYAPYTRNYAGAAVRTQQGDIVAAPVIENVAFNPSISPLQGVLVAMRLRGHAWTEIAEIALVETRGALNSHVPASRQLLDAIGNFQPTFLYADRT